MAYDRHTNEIVGRGGLSRTPIEPDWGQLYAFLPDESWVHEAHRSKRPFKAHAHWLEIGWALRRKHWGQGYASEIGRAGLTYAFDVLAMRAVVSCTARHNLRSRAVMERIGMRCTRGRFKPVAPRKASTMCGTTLPSPSACCCRTTTGTDRHWDAYSHLVEETQAAALTALLRAVTC